MRVRFCIRKGAPARWLSHLDMSRAWMRAMIRAGLPLAYSQGFNPHPKLAFSPALSVGVGGESEYLDARFSEPVEARSAIEQLNAALPAGLAVTAGLTVPTDVKIPSLSATIAVADYLIVVEGAGVAEIEKALTEHDILVKKMDGEQTGTDMFTVWEENGSTHVWIRVPIRAKPLAIMEDALGDDSGVSLARTVIDRLALWVIVDGRLVDPLMALGSFK